MDLTIRTLKEEDIELVNEFYNRIYQSDRSVEDFVWEFINGPFGKAIYIIAVVEEKNKHPVIIGTQAVIPIELIDSNGKVLLTGKSEDTLVDPEFRGNKIFDKMYSLAFEESLKKGLSYIWGFTPAKRAFEKVGFQIPFKLSQGLYVFNIRKSFDYLSGLNRHNGRIEKMKIFGLVVFSYLAGLRFKNQTNSNISYEFIDLDDDANGFDNFLINPNLYFLNMTQGFRKWRLINNPYGNNYQRIVFKKNGELVADVIINIRVPGYIEQVVFHEQLHMKTRKQIMRELIWIMSDKVDFIRALCFNSNLILRNLTHTIDEAGFTVLNRGNYFVWKSLNKEQKSTNAEDIYLSRLFTQGNL